MPRSMATPLYVELCDQADAEHSADKRQYAHTFHRANLICVSSQFYKLPETIRLAILLHEVGHRLAGVKGSEVAADKAVERASGVRVYYRDSHHGKDLQYIRPRDKQQAREFLFGDWRPSFRV